MSYTPGFFDGSNFTFQNNMQMQNFQNIPSHFPLPPPPPPPVTPFLLTPELTDQDYVQKFENRIPSAVKPKINFAHISELNESLCKLVLSLQDMKNQEETLSSNVDTLSEEQWSEALKSINVNKNVIQTMLSKLSSSYLDMSRKLIAKRTAKRLRLKRLKEERKIEKKERIKELEERSRKIDENLQKIKDDIQRVKQEEEAKIQADILLKEVIRKKHDARKSIAKLDALVKLRRARHNTARGRGQEVSEAEASAFQNSIERIKKLWEYKLSTYEKEESDSRAQLEQSSKQTESSTFKELEVKDNLIKWRQVLFGRNLNPQVDFKGDLERFINVREGRIDLEVEMKEADAHYGLFLYENMMPLFERLLVQNTVGIIILDLNGTAT